MPKITSVIGLGYLGVTQAAVLASLGHRVMGVDPDEEKVAQLNSGQIPFFEPGLQELFQFGIDANLLSFTTSLTEQFMEVDVHFLCVGTPSKDDDDGVDTKFLFQAIEQLAPFLNENSTIVGRSTVPVGTAADLESRLSSLTAKSFNLIWNPEFLSEGSAVRDSLEPERIVIGSNSPEGERQLKEIYKDLIISGVPVFTLDRQTSELVKVASNAFLALKISFINGVAQIAERTGASTSMLANAMGVDTRIGRKFLNNGLGFGGGCLPKDLVGFTALAAETGAVHFKNLLNAVLDLNSDRVNRVLEIAHGMLPEVRASKITILGAAFKPNTDDIRHSPALQLAEALADEGAIVTIHDPIALAKVAAAYPQLITEENLDQAFLGSELVILATEWDEYKSLNFAEIKFLVKFPQIVDARNILDVQAWRSVGWNVVQLGEG